MSWSSGSATSNSIEGVVEGLTRDGFPMISMTDLIQWGNDTHIARVDTTYGVAQTALGFSASKVNLLAASAGTAPVLNWALANLSLVQSIGIILPAVDLQAIDTDNRTDLVSLAHATYGPSAATGYNGAVPDDHNPADNAASFAGIPINLWYSTNDQVVLPSEVTTFAGAAGASCTAVSLGDSTDGVGHGIGGTTFDLNQVRAFFNTNG